jgi:hypothetical protein
MGRFEGQTGVANRVKISLGPLLARARTLRREGARLMRELGKTSEEITALREGPETVQPGRENVPQPSEPKMRAPA